VSFGIPQHFCFKQSAFFNPLTLALSLLHKSPTRTLAALFYGSVGHTRLDTHTHTLTQGRTPLNDRSACHRGRYLHNRQQTHRTHIHALSRIRTHNLSKQAASVLALHRTATGIGYITTTGNKCAVLTTTSKYHLSAKTGNERRSLVDNASVRVLSIITPTLILMIYYVNIRSMAVFISS
jgi:hypothetical protein